MVIASDQKAARAYAAVLTKLTGETPTLVLSDDPGSSARISQFAAGTGRWLVAVRMVSEGVDVPRLSVGVYATSASTPLFFAQAIGRFVRSRQSGETASIFLPSVPACWTWPARWKPNATTYSAGRTARSRASTMRRWWMRSERSPRPTRTRVSNHSVPTPSWIRSSSTARRSAPRRRRAATRKPTTSASPGCSTPPRCETCCGAGRKTRSRNALRPARFRGSRLTASCVSCAVNSTHSCRSHTTAPESRTAGFTRSCAGSVAGRRSLWLGTQRPPARRHPSRARSLTEVDDLLGLKLEAVSRRPSLDAHVVSVGERVRFSIHCRPARLRWLSTAHR